MAIFRPIVRATPILMPPSVEDWLRKDHLARFVVDIVDQLDLSPLTKQYRGAGSAAYHPAVMLSLLVYGYATGVYLSRRIEAATHDSIARRYIAANEQPDHDSLCAFRKRFLPELTALFTEVLRIARHMKLLNLCTIALNGTKIHPNASRHSALSYGQAEKIEAPLEAEVKGLLQRADAADQEPLPAGLDIPEELTRRAERLAAIRAANAEIEARAAERDSQAQAEHTAKLQARAEKEARTSKKPGGKPPTPPSTGVRATDQVNLTDPHLRIMPVMGRGFEQCYNAQAAVDTDSMLVVATTLTQAPNDKDQIEPMLAVLGTSPAGLGTAAQLVADNGYFSAANAEHCVGANIKPLLAAGRNNHHPHWVGRFTEPPALLEPATAVERMEHRLQTGAGRQLYGLRKQTVEPLFGTIKSAMGLRQFLLRGMAAVQGEWTLVTMALNIKRTAVLAG